jgi:hypothetical protein
MKYIKLGGKAQDTTRAKTDDFAHQIHYNESEFGLRIIISAPGHGDGERAGNGVEDCPHYLTLLYFL